MPAFFNSPGGVPITVGMPRVRSFLVGGTSMSPYFQYPYAIRGVTQNSTGAALGGCIVTLFRTADDSVAARTVSDVNGNYFCNASVALTHYVVAYKAGSPDVEGTTVNTLVGS